jgi:hypothetical protein
MEELTSVGEGGLESSVRAEGDWVTMSQGSPISPEDGAVSCLEPDQCCFL